MAVENAGRAFALVVVDELARRGVRHAVIAPGSRSTPLALAFAEHSKITVHVRIDERSAAYLALGLAKATGDVVPVLCTSGTAATYFHGAVLEADLARVPLLALTADRPAELHGIGANQTVEQSRLYGDAVRWSFDVPAPESDPDAVDAWRETVRKAVESCLGWQGAPPGPVHLNLALREPLVPVDDGIGFDHELGLDRDRELIATHSAPPARGDLSAALGELRNVVVLAGDNAGDAGPVARWCERAGWPLIAEPHSNARRGGAALRAADAILRDREFVETHAPELAVVVGRVGVSRAVLDWLGRTPHIVVSPDGGNWDVTRTARAVLHCSSASFDALDVERHCARPDWTAAWRERAAMVATAIDRALDESRLTEPQVARDVARAMPAGGALVVSSSMPIRDLDLVMEPREDLTVYANRGVSGIDGFVSTAIGIALARPDRQTVALCGDLSLLHDSNGFVSGAGPSANLTFVIVNNDGGGIFSLLPQGSAVDATTFEALFGTPHGVRIDLLASALGVTHHLVTTPRGLTAELAPCKGIRLLEVRTDRRENAALHARLRDASSG